MSFWQDAGLQPEGTALNLEAYLESEAPGHSLYVYEDYARRIAATDGTTIRFNGVPMTAREYWLGVLKNRRAK